MRALVVVTIAALLALLPDCVKADPPALTPCLLATSSVTVCKYGPGVFYGVVNNALSAQTATVSCYDNASAASGSTVAAVGALGVTQVIQWPAGGKKFTNGLTCQASATPTTPGVEIYFQ
jgi:hypothetical protein